VVANSPYPIVLVRRGIRGSQIFQDNFQRNFPELMFCDPDLLFEMELSDWLLLKLSIKIFWKFLGAKKWF
jgi:hypothetical protein